MAFEGNTIPAASTGTLSNGVFTDSFNVSGTDVDMVAIQLFAGSVYAIDVDTSASGSGGGDVHLRIFDALGNEVRGVDDGLRATDNVVNSLSPYLRFQPNYSGVYYIAVSPYYLQNYNPYTTAGRTNPANPLGPTPGTLAVTNIGTDAFPGANSISAITTEGVADLTDTFREDDRRHRVEFSGAIDNSTDVDMGRIDVRAGDRLIIDTNGVAGNGTVLRVFDSAGRVLAADDDGGAFDDAELSFTSGTNRSVYVGISGDGNATYAASNGSGTRAGETGAYEVIVHLNPTLVGTSGANSVAARAQSDYIVTVAGNDQVFGGDGFDTIAGGDNNDTLYGGNGQDVIYGEADNDLAYGGSGADVLTGGIGDDRLYGGLLGDVLEGGTGRDTLGGDAGNDTLRGLDGNDLIAGGDGNDRVFGGTGNDVFTDTAGNDVAYGDAGFDQLFGGAGFDFLDGGTQGDSLYGGTGNDFIYGDSGNDRLDGGAGNDRLYGEAGIDSLFGGVGDDRFVFLATGQGLDYVEDFVLAGDDRIDLSAIFAASAATVAANFGQYVRTVSAGGGQDAYLLVDANGAAGGAQFTTLAYVDGVTAGQLFSTSNFLL